MPDPDCPNCRQLAQRVARLEAALVRFRVLIRIGMRATETTDPVELSRLTEEMELMFRERTDGL